MSIFQIMKWRHKSYAFYHHQTWNQAGSSAVGNHVAKQSVTTGNAQSPASKGPCVDWQPCQVAYAVLPQFGPMVTPHLPHLFPVPSSSDSPIPELHAGPM